MNRSRAVPLLIALLSISALGVAATTLETSMTTDPDDEINPDWDRLPISEGEAASVLEAIGDLDEEGEEGDGDEDGEAGESGEESRDEVESRDVEGSEVEREGGADGEGAEAAAAGEAAEGTGTGDGSGEAGGGGVLGVDSATGPVPGEPSLLDRLLALLWALLPFVVALALGALAYRYRERLRSLLDPDPSAEARTDRASEADAWPGASPSNVVDEAWLAMIRRLDPRRPETTTADDCRSLAGERGVDAEAVETIATAFERVHYGGIDPSEEADRAREGLGRLDARGTVGRGREHENERRRGVNE